MRDEGPRDLLAVFYTYNDLLPTITAYDCVPRSPPGVGAGPRAGIQNRPAGRHPPLTAHDIGY